MDIQQAINQRITNLLIDSEHLSRGDSSGQVYDDDQLQRCNAWIIAAQNVFQLICTQPNNVYRLRAEKIANTEYGYGVCRGVGELKYLLRNLVEDIEAGLITTIANHVSAEVFDNFLEHGISYLDQSKKNEAGVICGVVFEDTLRKICRNQNIVESGNNLDLLISELAKVGILSATKAKRARAAAHVRTQATHAQWEEFDLKDVSATVDITKELIDSHLDM